MTAGNSSLPPGKTEENKEYAEGFQLYAIVGTMTLMMFTVLLDVSILGTAIPKITTQFHSVAATGWYAGCYQLASSSLQPLTGKIYSNFNSKWTLLIFFFVFEVGSLLSGAANSSAMLIAGRAIAGLGSSGLNNGSMTIIAGSVPLKKRPVYMGVILGVGQIGVISGPLIGGALTQYTTWRWCFYMNLPIGAVIAAFLVFLDVPDLTVKPPFTWKLFRDTVTHELDLLGFALFAPAAVMFLLALEFGGNSYAWNSSVIIGLFCGAGVTVIVFFLWESRIGEKAMLPLQIIRDRIIWTSAANMACLMVSMVVASAYLPTYFQAVRGDEPTMSGVSMLPSILSQLIMSIVAGVATPKMGYYLPWVIFGNVLMAIGNGFLSTLTPTTPTAHWVGYQILLGAGRGCGLQMGVIAVQNAVKPYQIPVAMAFLIFCQNFSGSVFTVVATTIFTQGLAKQIPIYAPSVSPEAAEAAGSSASGVRSLLPAGSPELPGLLMAYAKSIDGIFYMLIACACLAFFVGMGMGWKDTRQEKTPQDEKQEA
ncbi:efflux pump protein [Cryphonectria parasitica EP155]|uniref:Efflux pump protein n=1 Tax=Cryphonectria parasitica (strain ATCC 38755 / EP155) TaxID=660469 RepID=A0A9P5CPE4_CRYP1|nr:efflux pump protein [Cryphonectria parasitica EP155]KAF3765317.1 efflux pump protein [Cryphonectria parasitica EP155]